MNFAVKILLHISCIFAAPAVLLANSVENGHAAFDDGQYVQAQSNFEAAWETGDPKGGYYLARMLEHGLGVSADTERAMMLYKQAASAGNTEAKNRVALMYYHGSDGVEQNHEIAATLFLQAAHAGDANAQFNLGKMYFQGLGVPKDISYALALYKVAAEQDHILALNLLGALYLKGASTDKEREMAQNYFARSAAFGNAVGLFETGLLALQDKQDPKRFINAHVYFNLANARQHPRARQALLRVTALMPDADIQMAQAQAAEFRALVPDTSVTAQ